MILHWQESSLTLGSTEKTPGMFGTLVICLPSQHAGGKVGTKHIQKEKTFDTSKFSAGETRIQLPCGSQSTIDQQVCRHSIISGTSSSTTGAA